MKMRRTQLLIGFLCAALIVYFLMLGRVAVTLIADGRRAGFAHQKLSRLAAERGMELDVSDMPRRASGRIERQAADDPFETVRTELDEDPDNWVRWYRVARAYDYAGDRTRAREAMRQAVILRRQHVDDVECSPGRPIPRSTASRWSGDPR